MHATLVLHDSLLPWVSVGPWNSIDAMEDVVSLRCSVVVDCTLDVVIGLGRRRDLSYVKNSCDHRKIVGMCVSQNM